MQDTEKILSYLHRLDLPLQFLLLIFLLLLPQKLHSILFTSFYLIVRDVPVSKCTYGIFFPALTNFLTSALRISGIAYFSNSSLFSCAQLMKSSSLSTTMLGALFLILITAFGISIFLRFISCIELIKYFLSDSTSFSIFFRRPLSDFSSFLNISTSAFSDLTYTAMFSAFSSNSPSMPSRVSNHAANISFLYASRFSMILSSSS